MPTVSNGGRFVFGLGLRLEPRRSKGVGNEVGKLRHLSE